MDDLNYNQNILSNIYIMSFKHGLISIAYNSNSKLLRNVNKGTQVARSQLVKQQQTNS